MTLLLAYARERLLRRDVLTVAILVGLLGQIGRGATTPEIFLTDVATATGLVFAFRIWDDVMDRERDRLRHPERAAVRARSIASIAAAAAVAGVASTFVAWRVHGAASAWLLVAFGLVLAGWYATRGQRSAAGDRLLLSKYGVFTLALIGEGAFRPRALVCAAAVYVSACVYEWRHDRESRVFSLGGSR